MGHRAIGVVLAIALSGWTAVPVTGLEEASLATLDHFDDAR